MLSIPFLLSFALATSEFSFAKPIPGKVATAWYAGWHSKDFPLSDVSWEKYTRMTYAFAETTPDVNTLSLEGSNPALLPEFIRTAKQHGVMPSVSLGGWTGSRFFSSAVATPENRTAFVKTVTDFADKYRLDALDFDWEYPGRQGLGCNTISPNDTSNFLLFLQELKRTKTGARLSLSAAVSLLPFANENGEPSADVSGFAKVFDHIAIMNYDVWGSWSVGVGPNSPLADSCVTNPAYQQGSATMAVKAWMAAGMPAHQILLGVPAYGHSFSVTKDNAITNGQTLASYPPFDSTKHQPGDAWDGAPGVDACGVQQTYGGNYNYWGLISNGFLTKEGKAGPGILYRYDECSQTPYVYNSTSEIMVSYDDVRSFSAKGSFIKSTGLGGFAMWEAGGDYQDMLLDSIRASAGFPKCITLHN